MVRRAAGADTEAAGKPFGALAGYVRVGAVAKIKRSCLLAELATTRDDVPATGVIIAIAMEWW